MGQKNEPWYALYPYGGGGVGAFRPIFPLLGNRHRHVPVLPGRDTRSAERPLREFNVLADDLWDQLERELQQRPANELILFGYSLGGMMAFEMAARLTDAGLTPRGLVVGGCASPGRWSPRGIANLAEEQFVDRLKSLGIAPAELLDSPDMRALFMDVWRADSAVAESVVPRRIRLGCPVVAVAGNRDPLADRSDLEGWEHTGGAGSTSMMIGGDHGTLIHNPVLLARALRMVEAA